jgi:hypothetical protein
MLNNPKFSHDAEVSINLKLLNTVVGQKLRGHFPSCVWIVGNLEVIQRSHGGLSDEVLEKRVLRNFNSPGAATRASYRKRVPVTSGPAV